VTLHLRRFGGGPRLTLALHASLAHGGAFRALAAQMPDRAFVCPDLPGHGESPDWDGSADIHDISTAAVADLLAELGPVDLLGHSFGGTVALRLALARPDLVRTLTLVEPVLFAAARGMPEWEDNLACTTAFDAALKRGDLVGAARAFLGVWGGPGGYEALPQSARDYVTRRIGLIRASEPALSGDAAGILPPGRIETLALPVALVAGEKSPPITHAILRTLAARMPRAETTVVPGAGHMSPITHPVEVAAAFSAAAAEAGS
jgi:pimeloyl-ACP methyl ester carboxylesterase